MSGLPVVDKTAVQLEDRMVVVSPPFPFLLGLPAMGYMPATAVVLQPNPSLWLGDSKVAPNSFLRRISGSLGLFQNCYIAEDNLELTVLLPRLPPC